MTLTVEQRLQRLEDEAAIREAVARFADTAVRADYAGFVALWTPTGTFTINEPFYASATGSTEITTMLRKLRDGREFFVQFAHSGVIDLQGDRASARWIMHEVGKGPDEHYYTNYGLFVDQLEKVNGQWLFASRSYHYLYLNLTAFAGEAHPLPPELAVV